MQGVFADCTGLTENIPNELFDSSPNIDMFGSSQRYDSHDLGATYYSIPPVGAFGGCTGLTGNAPELWSRTNVTDSTSCFKDCTNLTNYADIPANWK